jgi:hypothetical protein
LDFTNIKSNFINYLQSQDTFKDYNFAGSTMSTLLDILAYNTQYNAYYLNMVANEMFLDSAIQRGSVVSHAKLLNYTPKSAVAPTATINITFNGVANSSFTIPKYTNFMSQPVNGVNYNFVTSTSNTVATVSNTATFTNIALKQGVPSTYSFVVNNTTNPNYVFQIPDANIDTGTISVIVQQSTTNTAYQIYHLATNYLTLDGNSNVYFLQEALNGNYEIYFGDGILGKKLSNGNIVSVSYISTSGINSFGANSFTLMDSIPGYTSYTITPVTPATQGGLKESVESIKFQAPKTYAAQGRAVTKTDYITLLQQNTLGYAFDAVNVWGGEENNPPNYGNVYIAIKPSGSYVFTDAQKQAIINNVILPNSILTVKPIIVNPDYVYLLLNANIVYDPRKTTLTAAQMINLITSAVQSFCTAKLNKFNSTFVVGDLIQYIQGINQSIVAVDFDAYVQKRLIPTINLAQSYTLNFGNRIENGLGARALSISPSFAQYDASGNYYPTVYFEPSPDNTTNIDLINVVSGGSGYTNPIITISGDGNGAKAVANVVNGIITSITVTSGGAGYTQAIISIVDSTGTGATAAPILRGNYGFLRTYYYNNGIKNVLTGAGASQISNAGSIDYTNGIVTLNNFSPTTVNSKDGLINVTGYAYSRTVTSTFNQILTLDVQDPAAVSVNLTPLSQ